MQDLLIVDSLRALQARGSDLADQLNEKLTEVYRWYSEELNSLSDDMLTILDNPETARKHSQASTFVPVTESPGSNTSFKGDEEAIEMSLTALSVGDRIVEVESLDQGTRSWPRFWLHSLLGCSKARGWVSEEDLEPLSYLNDVRVEVFEANEYLESFTITFHFTENPFFSNSKLSRSFEFDKNTVSSESTEIDWTCTDDDKPDSGFFTFFESSIDYEDLELAMCIKDRIRRNPLKYVLRYQAELRGEEADPDSDDEEPEGTQVGARYPFSWLFSK